VPSQSQKQVAVEAVKPCKGLRPLSKAKGQAQRQITPTPFRVAQPITCPVRSFEARFYDATISALFKILPSRCKDG
jgi:hypothetical protein